MKQITELRVIPGAVDQQNCNSCGLHETAKASFFQVIQNNSYLHDTNCMLFVVDKPHFSDSGKGSLQYTGNGFNRFREDILDSLECQWYFTSAVRCSLPKDEVHKARHYAECNKNLQKLIVDKKPKVLVAIGKQALNACCSAVGLKAPSNFNDVKGGFIFCEELNLRIYAIAHFSGYFFPDKIDDLNGHYYNTLSNAEAYCKDEIYREAIQYNVIDNIKSFAETLRKHVYDVMAFDVETNYPIFDKRGVKDPDRNNFYKPGTQMVSLSVTIKEKFRPGYKTFVLVDECLSDKVLLSKLFRDKQCVAHNAGFDINALEALCGIDVFELAKSFEDTQIPFYIRDQNQLFTNLKDLSRAHIEGVTDWESEAKELVVRANMSLEARRVELKKQQAEVFKVCNTMFAARELQQKEVLTGAESRKLQKMLAVVEEYGGEAQISKRMNALDMEISRLPKAGLCSYADIPIANLAKYNAEDTLRTLQLWLEVIPYMEKNMGWTYDKDCYEMCKDFIYVTCIAQRNGFRVNKEKLIQLEEDLKKEITELREKTLEHPAVVEAASQTKPYLEAVAKNKPIPWNKIVSASKDDFMGMLAKRYGVWDLGNVTETTRTFRKLVLPKIIDKLKKKNPEGCVIFENIDALRAKEALLSKFINNWKIWMSPDGYFHPQYRVLRNQNIGFARGKDVAGGSQGGRLSASNINIQQVPKLFRLREVFEPEEDYFIAEFDYASLEPRVMAFVTGSERLKEVFRLGLDIYRVTCNDAFQRGCDIYEENAFEIFKEIVSDKERKMFKTGFLAWVYGAGARNLSGVLGIPVEEAQDFIDRIRQAYTEIENWKKCLFEEIREGNLLFSFTGRQWTLPVLPPQNNSEEEKLRYRKELYKAYRIGANRPIQSLGSDMTLIQARRILKYYKDKGMSHLIKLVAPVHDALYFYVHKSVAKEVWNIKRMMEDASVFKFNFDVPLTVEFTVGYNYGQSMGTSDQEEEQKQLMKELGICA